LDTRHTVTIAPERVKIVNTTHGAINVNIVSLDTLAMLDVEQSMTASQLVQQKQNAAPHTVTNIQTNAIAIIDA